jgi:hypothetical protein
MSASEEFLYVLRVGFSKKNVFPNTNLIRTGNSLLQYPSIGTVKNLFLANTGNGFYCCNSLFSVYLCILHTYCTLLFTSLSCFFVNVHIKSDNISQC